MVRRPHPSSCLAALIALAPAAFAEPVPRAAPTAGEVVETRVGEEIELVEAPAWRGLEVRQDVKAGDVIRTNAAGQVAVVFADQTQLRLGRNSTLVVQEVSASGDTRLFLSAGRLFGRAARGGSRVLVDTPAATAAVRGTDWTLAVDGARTTLTVLDGVMDFTNPQGSLTLGAGEAAVATIGQAPTRLLVVASDTREQMLINLTLRGAFEALSPTAIAGPALRAEGRRIAAIPPAERGAEDRVAAAELALSEGGQAAALAAVAEARRLPLTGAQAARVTLVEAIVAANRQHYAEAARLFDQARPGLSGEQATAAAYQAYFARSLADPTRTYAPPAPRPGDRVSVVGQAIIAAFLDSPRAGYERMARAAPGFADDPAFLAALAEAAMLVGEFDVARDAAARAYRLDPEDPDVLSARAGVLAEVDRDLDAALASLERAIAITPAAANLWNDLGLLQSDRGADREAEAAFRRAIELDPLDPTARANYAVLLLQQNRIPAARAQIDAAIAVDPSSEVVYFADGLERLQRGDTDGAIEGLLRATAANPAYSNGLLVLGAAHAAEGEFELARQAFENADRLDPNDPLAAQYLSALSVFEYRADDAIRHAQEAVRRTRARGGDFASITSTSDYGSSLGGAYRNLRLDAWGDFWGDVTFDPLSANGYFDRALSGGPTLFTTDRVRALPGPGRTADRFSFSNLAQGLLLDPLALVAPELQPGFVRTPFFEVAVGGGPVRSDDGRGAIATATAQVLGTGAVPFAAVVSAQRDSVDLTFGEQDESQINGLVGFGLQPTAYDRFVGLFVGVENEGGLAYEGRPLSSRDRLDGRAVNGMVGWSHTFGYRNVLQAVVDASRFSQDFRLHGTDPVFAFFPARLDSGGEQNWVGASVGHILGIGDVTLSYGGAVGRLDSSGRTTLTVDYPPILGGQLTNTIATGTEDQMIARAWVDGLAEVGDRLRLEAGILVTDVEGEDSSLDPRLGAAWAVAGGHWLRAAWIVQRATPVETTLAPSGLLGLDPARLPVETGTQRTGMLSWDAEWTPRLFTSVEYQHVEADDFGLSFDGSLDPLAVSDPRFDRLAVAANVWLNGGIGLSGTLVRTWSEAETLAGDGSVPFLPDYAARFGITHVNPRGFRVELSETYLGARETGLTADELDGAWVADASAAWESPSRRWQVELGLSNLFDADYEVAPGVDGLGRTATALVTARF